MHLQNLLQVEYRCSTDVSPCRQAHHVLDVLVGGLLTLAVCFLLEALVEGASEAPAYDASWRWPLLGTVWTLLVALSLKAVPAPGQLQRKEQ